ncbi:ABC transporter permease [Mycobacterium sp. 236(2023)]|uniref:ABC transporter permease n=1 Tax=Mycobacterium sp. 236(2023) TaxID=3038163 RepID=UPI002415858B|nr:ABC transporter permease [Mycobacterium sp. 236(2023)]MDG4668906.1 ABC transporter permease [Mycobacterium sp. 236(2023)]
MRTSPSTTTVILAERMMTHWRRNPVIPMQSLLLPTLLLLTYHLVVSKSMVRLTGADNLSALVPMCTVAGAMMGAIGAGFRIPAERESGLLSRLWVQPVQRYSLLAGTLAAEGLRTLGAGVIIVAVGVALGLRFDGSPLAIVPFLLIPVMVVVVFATIVASVAVTRQSTALLTVLGGSAIGLSFCTGGIAPVDLFPSWLQPLIRFQPLTPVVESMRALADGDPAGPALLAAAAWMIVLLAIFGPLAARGYRRAAQSGGAG